MKFFIDTEFLEGTQTKNVFGIPFGQTKPTIDLISIGIVSEDGREYYAISKDFNLKEAWNRYDLKKEYPDDTEEGSYSRKVYWIRENVLKPILFDLYIREFENGIDVNFTNEGCDNSFTFRNFKKLINKYGKSNKQIAEEICKFIDARWIDANGHEKGFMYPGNVEYPKEVSTTNVKFYGYFADYDWVVFAWLFGKMIDLPAGFPMYCIDLKQRLDEKILKNCGGNYKEIDRYLKNVKDQKDYPKQTNEHNALYDARWTHELYKFIQQL